MSGARIALNVIGTAILIAVLAVVVFLQMSRSGTTPSAANETIARAIGAAVRSRQVIFDEEIAISARGAQMRGLTLPAARQVQVLADGKTHADKGFTVYVMDLSEWDNFQNGKTFKHLPSFEGLKVRSFGQVGTLPAGSWAVVVQNSENIFNTMVVHLKVVIDPS